MNTRPTPLQHVLHRAFSRYLRLRPDGLRFPDGTTLASLVARIHDHHPARTLYHNKKPSCRSLDAAIPIKGDYAKSCAICRMRERCTVQLCLQLKIDGVPYDLMLAFTSLRNFLCFQAKLGRPLHTTDVRLAVLNRGRWGELTFHQIPSEDNAE